MKVWFFFFFPLLVMICLFFFFLKKLTSKLHLKKKIATKSSKNRFPVSSEAVLCGSAPFELLFYSGRINTAKGLVKRLEENDWCLLTSSTNTNAVTESFLFFLTYLPEHFLMQRSCSIYSFIFPT